MVLVCGVVASRVWREQYISVHDVVPASVSPVESGGTQHYERGEGVRNCHPLRFFFCLVWSDSNEAYLLLDRCYLSTIVQYTCSRSKSLNNVSSY